MKEIYKEIKKQIEINEIKLIENKKNLIILISLPNLNEISFKLKNDKYEIEKDIKNNIDINKILLELQNEKKQLKAENNELKTIYLNQNNTINQLVDISNKQNNDINKLKEDIKLYINTLLFKQYICNLIFYPKSNIKNLIII